MNKIILAKRNSVIFLATLLVLGTIATILPSVQAQPYYEDGYESEYTQYMQDYKSEYPLYPDNSDYKSKDSSSSVINKIKCNNINSNNNGVDVSLGVPNNDDAIAEAQTADNEGQATSANEWGYGNEYKQKDNGFKFVCVNNNDNENNVVVVNGTTPEPPISNPILTVSKEMFICSDHDIIPSGEVDGFQRFQIDCRDDSDSIPDPDSPVWVPWENCNVNEEFCSSFSEEDFTMQIEQNPGPNFIIFEFPGNSDGRSVIVESGTYQITEEVTIPNACPNTTYDDGLVQIVESTVPFNTVGSFCFTLEGDCSGTIQAGEEKACTVKNYLVNGLFQVPIGGLTASDTNTDTSSFDINTSGGLASSFSSPSTIAQGTEEDSSALTATEKITKLKQQWMELTS